jgi:hypothetical protein
MSEQPPSATPPPPGYQPPPGYSQPPPAPGYMPPPIGPATAVATAGVMQQFSGMAAWSIGIGLVSIGVPLFTNFYFPILPIFGVINGARAIQRGRLIGGIIGIVLNLLGGLVSLIASGLINPGG